MTSMTDTPATMTRTGPPGATPTASPSEVPVRAWLRAGLAVGAVAWGANQFTPMLLWYQGALGLSPAVTSATFGLYAIGLVPGLLVGGPLSDRVGRRRVLLPALLVSLSGTAVLIAGQTGAGWLFAGRLIGGLASGMAFSAGAAWVRELSRAHRDPATAARRVVTTMTIGFAAGPLVSGVLAQWAPWAGTLPYLPHLALVLVLLPLLRAVPETAHRPDRGTSAAAARPAGHRPSGLRSRRFLLLVLPLAPWTFGGASISMAFLPGLFTDRLPGVAILFAAVSTVLTAGSGVLVQPVARLLDRHGGAWLLAAGLTAVTAGALLAAVAAGTGWAVLVLPAAVALGGGYGLTQAFGLRETQRLAGPTELASLTAVYQAASYLGFAAPYLLALLAPLARPGVLLAGMAALAAGTMAWTLRAQRRYPAPRP